MYHRLRTVNPPCSSDSADLGLRSHRSVSPTLLFPMYAPPLPPLTLPIAHDERPWRCGAPPTGDGHLTAIHAPSHRAMHGRSGRGAASALSYRFSRSARPAPRKPLPANPSRSQHACTACTTRKQQRTRATACPSRTRHPTTSTGGRGRCRCSFGTKPASRSERIVTLSRRGEERKDATSGDTGQRRTALASGCELEVRNGAAAGEGFAKTEKVGSVARERESLAHRFKSCRLVCMRVWRLRRRVPKTMACGEAAHDARRPHLPEGNESSTTDRCATQLRTRSTPRQTNDSKSYVSARCQRLVLCYDYRRLYRLLLKHLCGGSRSGRQYLLGAEWEAKRADPDSQGLVMYRVGESDEKVDVSTTYEMSSGRCTTKTGRKLLYGVGRYPEPTDRSRAGTGGWCGGRWRCEWSLGSGASSGERAAAQLGGRSISRRLREGRRCALDASRGGWSREWAGFAFRKLIEVHRNGRNRGMSQPESVEPVAPWWRSECLVKAT